MSLRLAPPKGRSLMKKAGRKSSLKFIRAGILALILAVFAVQLWTVLRYVKRTEQHDDVIVGMSNGAIAMIPPAETSKQHDYIMWSKEEASMRNCELHIKHNATWGKIHAPYVDKIEAKNIVERMNVPSLKIIPTLAVLDINNITTAYSLEFMKSLKQPYIIKCTHVSGGVARVYDNKYHCFKFCHNDEEMPLDQKAFEASKIQMLEDLKLDYSNNGGELQYRYIRPNVIFEEDVILGGKTNTDVTYWWLSNGHPVFVSEQCNQPTGSQQGFQMSRVYLGTDFRRLPIVHNRATCKDLPEKSKSWETQLEIMKQMGQHFPGEVVRIDVYAGGKDVWFSELTYTTSGCWKRFTPALADGLLYELMKGRISPDIVTPAYIERVLKDRSWVAVSLDDKSSSGSYPSPVDLCQTLEDFSDEKRAKKKLFNDCIRKLNPIQKFSLRCLVTDKNGTVLLSFGVNGPVTATSNVEFCALRHKMISMNIQLNSIQHKTS